MSIRRRWFDLSTTALLWLGVTLSGCAGLGRFPDFLGDDVRTHEGLEIGPGRVADGERSQGTQLGAATGAQHVSTMTEPKREGAGWCHR